MVHKRKPAPPKDIALERIHFLSGLARKKVSNEPELAKRYMQIVERMAKRLDISLPAEVKRFYCKRCGHPYGSNTRVRIKDGFSIVSCGFCEDIRRLPLRN